MHVRRASGVGSVSVAFCGVFLRKYESDSRKNRRGGQDEAQGEGLAEEKDAPQSRKDRNPAAVQPLRHFCRPEMLLHNYVTFPDRYLQERFLQIVGQHYPKRMKNGT
jgi:hypothetical protein